MMPALLRYSLTAFAFATMACASSPQPAPEASAEPVTEAEIARAREALNPLKTGLPKALQAAIASDGHAGAVTACSTIAPSLAESGSTETVKVGRTSTKLRNPKNAPADWMQPILNEWTQRPPAEGSHAAVRLADGTVGYAEPIFVKPLCTSCHGESIPVDVRAVLKERYPQDQATGYQAGDFRGMFWVTLRLE